MLKSTTATTSMITTLRTLPLSDVPVFDSDVAAVDCDAALFTVVGPGVARMTKVEGTVMVSTLG